MHKSYLIFVFLFFIQLCFLDFAVASRARIQSLQGDTKYSDTESVFLFPTKIMELKEFLVVESGSTASVNQQDGAFAAATKSIFSDQKILVSLGRQNDFTAQQRLYSNQLLSENYELGHNPISVAWAYRSMGRSYAVGLSLSEKNDKLNQLFEKSKSLQFGYRWNYLTFSTEIPIENKIKTIAGESVEISRSIKAAILYEIDSLILSAEAFTFLTQPSLNLVEQEALEHQDFKISLNDITEKDNHSMIFRVEFINTTSKYKTTAIEIKQNFLPMTFAFESQVKNWLTLRSSLQQNFLISKTSDEPSSANTTVAAVGAGLHFNQLVVDGTFKGIVGATQTQRVDGQNLLSQVSLTYMY